MVNYLKNGRDQHQGRLPFRQNFRLEIPETFRVKWKGFSSSLFSSESLCAGFAVLLLSKMIFGRTSGSPPIQKSILSKYLPCFPVGPRFVVMIFNLLYTVRPSPSRPWRLCQLNSLAIFWKTSC